MRSVTRPNPAMQRSAGRSAFPLSMASTFNLQRTAPSPVVADLVLRPTRAVLLLGCCLVLSGCMKKTNLDPPRSVTRVVISSSDSPEWWFPPPRLGDDAKASAVVAFIDSHRFNWTRAIGVGFGVPHPAYYAHLYEGDRYLGYFGVGAGALPSSSALFEVR